MLFSITVELMTPPVTESPFEEARPEVPADIPPEKVLVAVLESLMMTLELMTPPVMVRPFDDARPPLAAESPPLNVEVADPVEIK